MTQEPLFEPAMRCPACGCQFCPNCFGALCDCDTLLYRHDVSHCWEPSPEVAPAHWDGHSTEEKYDRLSQLSPVMDLTKNTTPEDGGR